MTHHHQLPFLLTDEIVFPDVDLALTDPNGLLAVGGDLSRERLIQAYQQGIFPWYSSPEPIIWWSPDPRAILYLDELKVSRSLAKSLRNRNFEVWLNRDFNSVIKQCAGARDYAEDTWITSEMQTAYSDLHACGFAHSISIYQDDKLVGGLYGLSQGKFFFGESMFSKSTDASKVALYYLVNYLKKHDFLMVDCQVPNSHLTSLGSRNVTRKDFIQLLQQWRDWPQPEAMWKSLKLNDIISFCPQENQA
ncbi:MAG: leucyl/phenylalanyl-tRNA--protein transferase [Gammaproteobacteria bacterium]|nr:MAG: leucyl/phenylalanyl-tRNA--protein transferase [Gammaproteobacteria bacterium]